MEGEAHLTGDITAEEQYASVMEQYGRLLRAAIVRVCPRDMAADYDDIRQDACLRLWRALSSGRKIPSPASYLYRVAATATIDAIRRVKARRETAIEQLDPDGENRAELRTDARESPDRTAAERELVEKTLRTLTSFSSDRRRAVALHLQGLTTREIGDLLGWSEPKARNLVYRALKDLRTRLHAEGIDYDDRRP